MTRPLTRAEQRRYPGIQTQRHMRADGTIRVYRYYRATSLPVFVEPGTLQFEASYKAAKRGDPTPVERSTIRRRFVYFVQCEALGYIKIGSAQNPRDRILNIQNGCPDRLKALGVIPDALKGSLEKDTHLRFAHLHLRGEWFRPGEDLLAFIAQHAKPLPMRRKLQQLYTGKSMV